MVELANLQVVVGIDSTAAERGLDALGTKVGGVGSAIQTALGAAAVGAVVGLGAAFVGSVKTAADFEKGLSAISAVSGATKEELEGIRQTALQLGKDTSFSAVEAAAGMEEMIKAGVSLTDTMNGGARAALDLAAAGGTSVPEAAAIMSNAMNTFRDDMLSAAETANIITGAANASAISVHDFGFSLSAVGAVAAQIGLPLKDTAVAIAILGQNGLKGADAGTSLKAMFNGLIPTTKSQIKAFTDLGLMTTDLSKGMAGLEAMGLKPQEASFKGVYESMYKYLGIGSDATKWTTAQAKAFQELNLKIGLTSSSFFDSQGAVKGTADMADILNKALAGLSEEQQLVALRTMFGTDGQRAASLMMKEGRAGVEAMTEAMAKQGDARRIADERLNNLSGSIEKLKGSLETGAVIFGSMFTPALKGMADTITNEVNAGIEVLEQIPDVIGTIKQVLAGEWAPDSSIHPFTNAVGIAAMTLNDKFGPAIRAVGGFITGTLVPAVQAILAPLGAGTAAFFGVIGVAGLVTAALGILGAALAFLITPLGAVALAAGVLAAAWTVNFGGIQEKTLAFVAIVQQALTGDVESALARLIILVTTTGVEIGTQLLLWGRQFVEWIAPMIPPMLAALAALAADLYAWISAQIPPLLAQLLLWGQEFVAWVAPQIPPLLAALGVLGAGVLTWLAEQIPPLIEQLLLWGAEFVAWVAPQIVPMIEQLGQLMLQFANWLIAQVPGITAELVKWGLLFAAWVVTTAIPELVMALPGIVLTIGKWIGEAAVAIAALVVRLGVALATGIFDGFMQAWPIIKGKIQEAIGGFTLPGFGGGAPPDINGTGATNMSYGGSEPAGGWAKVAWDKAVAAGHPNPAEFVRQINQESGFNPNARSGAGALGIAQFMPGTAAGVGVNPMDPDAALAAAATLMTAYYKKYGGNSALALAAYNAGPGAVEKFGGVPPYEETQQYVRSIQGGGAPMHRMPLGMGMTGGPPGSDPSHWPVLMQEVIDVAPDWQTAMAEIKRSGVEAFTGVGTGGAVAADYLISATSDGLGNVTRLYTDGTGAIMRTVVDAGGNLVSSWTGTMTQIDAGTTAGTDYMVSATTDALGNVTRHYAGATGEITRTVYDAAGNLVGTWGTIGADTVTATATMATGVVANTNLMSNGALASVTNLGTGILTSVTDSAGTTIATVTDMQGQVTSQYATLANGAVLTMGDMAAGVLTSTTSLGDGVMTTVQDMSGNYITTITDLSGNVTSQYTQLGSEVAATTATMSTDVTAETAAMSTGVTAETAGMNAGVVADVTAMAVGSEAAAVLMAQEIIAEAQLMARDTGIAANTMVSDVGVALEGLDVPVTVATELMQSVGDVEIEAPDVNDVIDAMKDVQKAAEKAAAAIRKVSSGDKSGGNKNTNPNRDDYYNEERAAGGWTTPGARTLVGERGPEVISTARPMYVTPNHQLGMGGGGDTYVIEVNVNGSLLANRRDIEEAVIIGLQSAQRRGRTS